VRYPNALRNPHYPNGGHLTRTLRYPHTVLAMQTLQYRYIGTDLHKSHYPNGGHLRQGTPYPNDVN
jgi:hypothetical protein